LVFENLFGFTLLEILIAMFIFSVVISTIYVSLTSTLRIVDETEYQAETYRMARIALERMFEDLSSVYFPQQDESLESGDRDEEVSLFKFVGEEEEIDGKRGDTLRFTSLAHLDFSEAGQSGGVTEIGYQVEESGEEEDGLVLLRSDDVRLGFRAPGEEPEEGQVVCDHLQSVSFTYYDSEGEAYDDWDSAGGDFGSPIPDRVSILLEFVNKSDEEAPFKFTTAVALPGAGNEKEE
jgi:general secretion pathway protein J